MATKFLDNTGLTYLWSKIKAHFATHGETGSAIVAADKAVSIPSGVVDSTSTSTAFTATVDGITELKKVVDTFYYAPINKIDKHIAPQSIQYDASCVGLFVELKDLPSFLRENGFENIETNKSPSKEYDADILAKYNSTLKQIYACDYNMIANIPEDKKYKAV